MSEDGNAKLIEKLDDRVTELEKQIADIEKNAAVNMEQTKMVFKILGEIKDSIKDIATKLDILEKRPGQNWQDLIKTVVTVTVTIAITYFIAKK